MLVKLKCSALQVVQWSCTDLVSQQLLFTIPGLLVHVLSKLVRMTVYCLQPPHFVLFIASQALEHLRPQFGPDKRSQLDIFGGKVTT